MKKKILHIQVLPILSGVQKVSLEILQNLSDKEYDKWILFSDNMDKRNKNICKETFENIGTKVIFSKTLRREIGFSDFYALSEIYKLCKKEKFDIVHTNSTKSGIVGRIAAFCANVPLVIHTVHGLSFHNYIKFPKWQFYWACEVIASIFCHKIVLVNNYYSKYFRWFKKKTDTIYNGISYENLQTRKTVKENTPLKLLYVGRLDEPKDPVTLLKAAKIILEKYPQCLFSLVGDGEKYNECEKFIKENGLSAQINLLGWQNNVSDYYATHHIFISSSIYEAFGLTFLEAGYYELPTACTNVEGIPEVVIDEYTGLLSNPRDENALANNIITLIENKNLRQTYGENAKKWVSSNFSVEKMVEKYKLIYANK